ncbi:hypothetical protein DM02DRAFT_634607 [Periconia macrospinosa]|uniref:Uncharacterized protein n=1 Tax=Periconia macrospinosa TaxID=97972 RepID=A0A2V1D5U1_9PLEO|nr:hypothetical protein DM02DRAFT_634607 [Periconia macrospinosa]
MRPSATLYYLFGLGTLTSHVHAEDEKVSVEFTLWDTSSCGQASNEAWTSRSTTISTLKTTPEWINCGVTSVGLGGWPISDEGEFIAYVDGGKIEDKCQLIFYKFPFDDEEKRGSSSCFLPFRKIGSGNFCERVFLPAKFGLVYCCGQDCDGPSPRVKRDESSAAVPVALSSSARDVTQVKRGPISRGLVDPSFYQKRDDGDCKFIKTSNSKVTYMKPKIVSSRVPCAPNGGDCVVEGAYETSKGITTSTSSSHSITAGVSGGTPFFQVTAEYGHEWSTSREESEETTVSGEGYFEGAGCGEEVQGGARECYITLMTNSVTIGAATEGNYAAAAEAIMAVKEEDENFKINEADRIIYRKDLAELPATSAINLTCVSVSTRITKGIGPQVRTQSQSSC